MTDIKARAQKIIQLYTNTVEGLTFETCKAQTEESDRSCRLLTQIYGQGPTPGEVTPEEQIILDRNDYPKEFIQELTAPSNYNAIAKRADFLAAQLLSNESWDVGTQESVIRELTDMEAIDPTIENLAHKMSLSVFLLNTGGMTGEEIVQHRRKMAANTFIDIIHRTEAQEVFVAPIINHLDQIAYGARETASVETRYAARATLIQFAVGQ